jgi:hypothetical protein
MLFKRKKETPPEPANVEEMFARLSKEHPEWRVGLLRYMLRQRERHRKLLEEK